MLSELIIGIAMSGTNVNQRDNIPVEQCYTCIMIHRIIQHTVDIMDSKAHYFALNLDGFIHFIQ